MTQKYKLLLGTFLASIGTVAVAGTPVMAAVPQAIPAISQAGLIGLAFVIGIIGARLISKFKATDT